MAKKPGQLCKFVCVKCGEYEMATGGNSMFTCLLCTPFRSAKYWAHQAVAKARRTGELADPKTLACADCGNQAFGYDHRDYSKPLDVQPVCRSCNALRGKAKQAA